jgi:hypothetical protein
MPANITVRIGSQCGSVTSRVANLTLDQKLQTFFSAAKGHIDLVTRHESFSGNR